jgi:hypothetical protein
MVISALKAAIAEYLDANCRAEPDASPMRKV